MLLCLHVDIMLLKPLLYRAVFNGFDITLESDIDDCEESGSSESSGDSDSYDYPSLMGTSIMKHSRKFTIDKSVLVAASVILLVIQKIFPSLPTIV